ncbi:MAG: RHS repeat-associated core domain-containing protein [Pirellula sp.]|jgi:RHS repeat-associated protein|nr:RHS repeat-associated core domain-containing protein [Pirellula sp.]
MLIHSHLPYDQSTSHARIPAGGINLIASIDSASEAQVTASFFGSTKALHGEVATTSPETTTHNHSNQQYSITAITTSAGTVAERYAYSAYGEPTILDGSGSTLSSSAINNRYLYTGREWDATVGLYHFRARWMSPKSGRFLGRDPIGYAGGRNMYSANWKLSEIDPLGTESYSVEMIVANKVEFPFPKLEDNVCAATECMETGIETQFNVNGPKPSPCGGYCKVLMVHGHEGEHRKNMGECCNRRNACLKFAETLPPAQIDRARQGCQGLWNLWKHANWEDLEHRAAVETCRLARQFKKNCDPTCPKQDNWQVCCADAKEAESQACSAMDANAPIESCPFEPDGFPDQEAIERNKRKNASR